MKKARFPIRHRIILFARDSKIKLFRYASNILRKILIPDPKGEIILSTIDGYHLIINPSLDKGVERDLYYYGTYERGILNFMSTFLKEGDVFLDIGANIGLMSIHASKLVGGKGKVLSFEANPDTFNILKKNISLNSCTNIELIPYALGSTNSKSKIYSNWHINRGGASLIKPDVDSTSFDIEIKRLDEFYKDRKTGNIKMAKIDVEGFELEVLRGFGILLTEKNAPALVVECSDMRGNFNSTKEDLFRFITKSNNYSVYKLKRGKEVISDLEEIQNESQLPTHDNIICLTALHIAQLGLTTKQH